MPVQYAQMSQSTWLQMQQQFSVYQISAVMLFFVIIGMFWLFRPAIPFVLSRFWHHDTVVGVVNKNRNIIPMNGFTLANGIWYYNGTPMPFVREYPGNYFFAGIPFKVLTVDLDAINSPVYKQYTERLIELGYPNILALERAILFSMMEEGDPRVDEIILREGYTSYEDAYNKINPANLSVRDPLVAPFFSSIPLSELMGYGADIPAENILGEVDDVYESRKPSTMAMRKIRDMLPWCIIILVVSIAAVVGYKVLMPK